MDFAAGTEFLVPGSLGEMVELFGFRQACGSLRSGEPPEAVKLPGAFLFGFGGRTFKKRRGATPGF